MPQSDPHTEAADAVHEGRPVAAQYVRGARPGVRILWILILSASAAAILLLGMWLVSNGGFAAQNDNIGRSEADAAAFSETAPPAPEASSATSQPAA